MLLCKFEARISKNFLALAEGLSPILAGLHQNPVSVPLPWVIETAELTATAKLRTGNRVQETCNPAHTSHGALMQRVFHLLSPNLVGLHQNSVLVLSSIARGR